MKLRNTILCAAGLGLALLTTGCADDGGDTPPTGMQLALYTLPGDADPFADVGFLRFLVTGDGLPRAVEKVVPYTPGGSAAIDGVAFTGAGQERQLTVEGWSAGPDGQPRNLISRGRSVPVAVPEDQGTLDLDVLFARVNHFLPLASSDTLAPQTLAQARVGHTTTPTPIGEIVVAGGGTVSRPASQWWSGAGLDQLTTTIESISQLSHAISARAPMLEGRAWHTASAIDSGQVIFAGGFGPAGGPVASVELYNPPGVLNGQPSPLPPLAVPRAGHTATLLDPATRLILFVGGDAQGTWELWDPTQGSLGAPTPLPDNKVRRHHCATVFYLSGRTEPAVFISGGESDTGPHATAMLFDSVARAMIPFSEAMPGGARTQHTATYVRERGFIYLAGGYTDLGRATTTGQIDVFEVDQQRFIPNNASFRMRTARGGHAAALMPNNTVVITGGGGAEPAGSSAAPLGSIEVIFEFVDVTRNELRIEIASSFNPDAPAVSVPYMPDHRLGHHAVALDNGMTLLVGGLRANPATGGFSMVPGLTLYNPAQ